MVGLIDGDVILYHSVWGSENLDQAKEKLDGVLQFWLEGAFASYCLVAVGGPNNFRDILYPQYKKSATREKARQNKASYFDDLKAYLLTKPNTVLCDGFETDDLIRMWATQSSDHGLEYVVCSIDKDLDCIPGKHWNPTKDLFYTVTEDQADAFYWKQILTGDSIDNIPGIPGVGPVKANKILENANTQKERKQRVINAYKEKYGDEWHAYLTVNGRLIHLWRTMNDHFTIKEEV